MAENESRKQGRQPGDIPRSVRQRTGSSGSSSEDEASAVDEARDKAWHESKGVPYAPIGSQFAYAGSTFLRGSWMELSSACSDLSSADLMLA